MGAFNVAFQPKCENRLNYTTEYVYREYPKYVTRADGSQVIGADGHAITAHTKEEEDAILASEAPADASGDRDSLMAEAQALGLNPHHKTGVEKLRQLIQESKGVSNA
jgi:hypothetical protein